jgi:WD40 repeat protein
MTLLSCIIAGAKHSSNHRYRYLLATCGNDSLVKLWYMAAFPAEEEFTVDCVLWRQLTGHGGNVMCVRFTPITGEILASTATDKTIRLWNVVSHSDQLHQICFVLRR